MTEIICPLCGKPNPEELDECQYCQAPLKVTGFIASPEDQEDLNQAFPPSEQLGETAEPATPLRPSITPEQSIPDWLKQTEASFLKPAEFEAEELTSEQVSEQIDALINLPSSPAESQMPVVDDDWLASLLSEAGVAESTPQEDISGEGEEGAVEELIEHEAEAPIIEEEIPAVPAEKPDWLADLEANSNMKLEGGMQPSETPAPEDKRAGVDEAGAAVAPQAAEIPDWISKLSFEESPPSPKETEPTIEPAEIPGWLEALRPSEEVTPTKPMEDVSTADVVTAGPLVGLRGVISAHPSAIQARKPPTYSIKLRVTEEQSARVQMMEELLADEQKPKHLPAKPASTSRYIVRIAIALILILPMMWAIVARSQQSPLPQPGDIPGVVDFSQQVQKLPAGAPVLLAFDYEPGFSGELGQAVSTVISQLISKNAYLIMVSTTPSGVVLAENLMADAATGSAGSMGSYPNYANLGYIPGGTLGLLGLSASPRAILPYSLDGVDVWARLPLSAVSSITDFEAVIVITNDADTARAWIEQVGTRLQVGSKPLLFITSTQAEPLVRPYYEAIPSQVQGLVAGLVGGLAYGRAVGGLAQMGVWDAFSIGTTMSILIILGGSIISLIFMLRVPSKKEED